MNKILVAIDLSRSSGNDDCLETAKTLAEVTGAAVALLYVVEPIPRYAVPAMPSGLLEKRKIDAEREIGEFAAAHHCLDVTVREGSPAHTILDYAEEIGADLIVLNSHDPGITEFIFGSVASRVVAHAHCSVFIVRKKGD